MLIYASLLSAADYEYILRLPLRKLMKTLINDLTFAIDIVLSLESEALRCKASLLGYGVSTIPGHNFGGSWRCLLFMNMQTQHLLGPNHLNIASSFCFAIRSA